ncbi:hypothetical protein TIFTF001_053410 [Ficus carica]|uniref:Uncharacterized protein n=1 Tax=Ficus carica TaxID=3494 RepID=A0AA88JGM6_FICCA|nr:hypothetical protein TIFTF001_053410 [Ficus carica]
MSDTGGRSRRRRRRRSPLHSRGERTSIGASDTDDGGGERFWIGRKRTSDYWFSDARAGSDVRGHDRNFGDWRRRRHELARHQGKEKLQLTGSPMRGPQSKLKVDRRIGVTAEMGEKGKGRE